MANLQLYCPEKCRCCCLKLKRRDRIFTNGYLDLERELHVTYLLKQIRIFKGILKEQMTKAQWQSAIANYSLKSAYDLAVPTSTSAGDKSQSERDTSSFKKKNEMVVRDDTDSERLSAQDMHE